MYTISHRRGISGDMKRRDMRKLEKSLMSAEEISAKRLYL
jgi:hypothetical protein